MALVMSMIVVVLITLLVAGALSFTGTERAASEVQTQESEMSACVQAARNLFLAKLELKMFEDPANPGFLPIRFTEDFGDPQNFMQLRTGHVGEPEVVSARRVDITDKMLQVTDRTGGVGPPSLGPAFYTVTAVCRGPSGAGGPEREIEFMVRTGI
jgi:hypothetical protein